MQILISRAFLWDFWSHFILGGLNYYNVRTLKLIFDAVHLLCTYMFVLIFKKYLHVITSVINFCKYIYIITLLTHPLHLNPPLNLPIPPNLSLTLTVSHLNNSKSVLQYNKNTISTLYLCFDVSA